jgi:hypothetical protein
VGTSGGVSEEDDLRARRLAEYAAAAKDAEARGDDAGADESWRRYRLVRDAGRDPDDLLSEGVALSAVALELAREQRVR